MSVDDNALAIAIDLRDDDIIQELVNRGANPTAGNKREAAEQGMGRSILPWKRISGSLVDIAVSAVSAIISYTEGGALNSITKGVLRGTYRIVSAQQNPIATVRSHFYDYLLSWSS